MQALQTVLDALADNVEQLCQDLKIEIPTGEAAPTTDENAISARLLAMGQAIGQYSQNHPEAQLSAKDQNNFESTLRQLQGFLSAPRSAGTTGILSQILVAIDNLVANVNQISNLTPEGAAIRQSVVDVIQGLLTNVRTMQSSGIQLADNGISILEGVIVLIDKQPQLSDEALLIEVEQVYASALQVQEEAKSLNIGATQTRLGELSGQSSAIAADLNARVAALEANIRDAERRKADAEKDRLKWLALGPFGLIGLAIAIGMIVSIGKEIDSLRNQANSDRLKLGETQTLLHATQQLVGQAQELVGQVGYLRNDIDIIVAELDNTMKNLAKGGDRNSIKLFILTTIESLRRLKEFVS